MTERLAAARKKAEALKSEIAKAQNEKKDCSINDAAAKKDLKNLGPGLKARRVLKGHFGKVYAMHWSGDNNNLVSASQVHACLSVQCPCFVMCSVYCRVVLHLLCSVEIPSWVFVL